MSSCQAAALVATQRARQRRLCPALHSGTATPCASASRDLVASPDPRQRLSKVPDPLATRSERRRRKVHERSPSPMPQANANASADRLGGTLTIGGDMTVHRLGFGAMRLCGPGIWGEPSDPDEARRVLKHVVELGITLI